MGDRDDYRYGRERGGGDGGRGDNRGFLERAGEEVRGWFRDDDDHDRNRDRGGEDRGYGRERGYQGGYGRGRESGGGDRMSYGPRGYSAQGNDEYRRGGGYRDDDDGRRPMTGDYGRRGGERDYGHDEDRYRPYGGGGYGDRNYGGVDAGRSGGGQGRYDQGRSGQSAYGQGQSGGGYDPRASGAQGTGVHDPHYHQWRERQMSELDRDYHEYRQENQRRFEDEFHGWRTARQGQRDALRQVREGQEVVGDDGAHVGTVDKVRGDQIVLNRKDPDAGGRHHAIPSSWIQGVGEKVMLNRHAARAKAEWQDWEREHQQEKSGQHGGMAGGQVAGERGDRALGHENDRDAGGPHVLERSFSGTYDRDGDR